MESSSTSNNIVHVLDLPQLYTKPTAQSLLDALESLRSELQIWHQTSSSTTKSRQRQERSEEVPAYLTRVISSRLAWIEDEDMKEQIWDTASKRLSERSGRTGMGALDRRFAIPLKSSAISLLDGGINDVVVETNEVMELKLHEPALTGDNLGLKTWASSYLLSRRLCIIHEEDKISKLKRDAMILELGAGTGLVGLSAAAVFRARTVLTDLPEIVPNLQNNTIANEQAVTVRGGMAEAAVLDWSDPSKFSLPNETHQQPYNSFPLILAADPIYSPEHPGLFANTVSQHLLHTNDARLVMELPIREAYDPERQDLRDKLVAIGLCLLEEGEEVGTDDWEDKDGGMTDVKCWWSIWGWSKRW